MKNEELRESIMKMVDEITSKADLEEIYSMVMLYYTK